MSKYGSMVLWMGIILMALQLAAEWSFIRNLIFTKGSSSTVSPSGSSGSSSPNNKQNLPPPPPGWLGTPSGWYHFLLGSIQVPPQNQVKTV